MLDLNICMGTTDGEFRFVESKSKKKQDWIEIRVPLNAVRNFHSIFFFFGGGWVNLERKAAFPR